MSGGNRPGGGGGGFGRLLQEVLNEMFDTSTRPPYGREDMSPEQRERQRELRRAQRRREDTAEEVTVDEDAYVTLEQRGLDREETQRERRRRARGPSAARPQSLRSDIRESLSSRRNVRRAFVLSEILGPPKGLQKKEDI